MPGKILLAKDGVYIHSSVAKNMFEAPPSVRRFALCIMTSLHPSFFASFILNTFPSKEVDLISHLCHLISSHTETFSVWGLKLCSTAYPKVSTSSESSYI